MHKIHTCEVLTSWLSPKKLTDDEIWAATINNRGQLALRSLGWWQRWYNSTSKVHSWRRWPFHPHLLHFDLPCTRSWVPSRLSQMSWPLRSLLLGMSSSNCSNDASRFRSLVCFLFPSCFSRPSSYSRVTLTIPLVSWMVVIWSSHLATNLSVTRPIILGNSYCKVYEISVAIQSWNRPPWNHDEYANFYPSWQDLAIGFFSAKNYKAK